MKKLILVFCCFLPFWGMAQTIVFNEGFEAGLGGMVQIGSMTWSTNDSIMQSGLQSAHNNYDNGNNSSLTTTTAMDLSSYNGALLEFYHICKVEITDIAVVLISTNGGGTWDTLGKNEYSGQAFLLEDQNFFDGSYTEWDYNNDVTPNNTWWKFESFNISAYSGAGMTNVLLRFNLIADAGLAYYGWLLDEVTVIGVTSGELDPPVIVHETLENTGSQSDRSVSAIITDATGVDSALLYYRIDAGMWNVVQMTLVSGDSFHAIIPGQPINTIVDYYLRAVDATVFLNQGFHPHNEPKAYHTYEVIDAVFVYPYLEDFEGATASQWTHKADVEVGNTGIIPRDDWEMGNPSKFFFNSPHSGVNAWVTLLQGGYSFSSRSSLLSPFFDLSIIKFPEVSFWHKHDASFGVDGARLDFSTDAGFTWQVLGSTVDPDANNWYNSPMIGSASNPIVRPGWTGQESNWKQSTYKLGNLAGPGKFIRFRFVFTSRFQGGDGWMIDDIEMIEGKEPPIGPGIASTDELGIQMSLFPNPTQDKFNLVYTLKEATNVSLRIFNPLGQLMWSKEVRFQTSGTFSEELALKDRPAGVYYLQLEAGQRRQTRKLVLLPN